MHAREMVEVAAMVAQHGPVLIEGDAPISTAALEQYWAASKCRADRWLRALKQFAVESARATDTAEALLSIRPLMAEILLAEIPLRVWTAVLYAYDQRHDTRDAEPIARSVLLSHLEVRQRALALLIHCPQISAEDAVQLNRLRRRVERWTDMLLSYLSDDYAADKLAFEPERCREFAADMRRVTDRAARGQAWQLTLASLRVAFQGILCETGPNEPSNSEIVGSMLACFPAGLFDATGPLRSLWMVRLQHAASDAQGFLDLLLLGDAAKPAGGERWNRLSGQAKRRF